MTVLLNVLKTWVQIFTLNYSRKACSKTELLPAFLSFGDKCGQVKN